MAEEDGEDGAQPGERPLLSGVLRHWSVVRCGCIEGVLATAILAGQHADVWDAASMLLREHCRWGLDPPPAVSTLVYPLQSTDMYLACVLDTDRDGHAACDRGQRLRRELPQARQLALQRTLEAAANQMSAAEKRRSGPGPPPLLSLVRPLPGADALQPRRVVVLALADMQQGLAEGSLAGTLSPFIYNPYKAQPPLSLASHCMCLQVLSLRCRNMLGIRLNTASMVLQVKMKEVPEVVAGGEAGTVCWVCGEASTVEVEIRNPTIIPIKVCALPDC